MAVSERDLEKMEDLRVLMVAKAQGTYGRITAAHYANRLIVSAFAALGAGDVERAIWLVERDFDFSCRIFGLDHPYSKTSKSFLMTLCRLQPATSAIPMNCTCAVAA